MHKTHLYDKILSPIVTEKSTGLSEQNKIVFKVPNKSNKTILKKNIEKIFKVNVVKVNIITPTKQWFFEHVITNDSNTWCNLNTLLHQELS